MSTPAVTPLFPNTLLARAERLRLMPHRRRTNRTQGEHHHGKGGTSTEFSDYRDYVAGDDVRFIDWNIFSRLNEPYLKLYQHEEEMRVVCVIDASDSMNFEGKFDLARQLAAVFSTIALASREKASAYVCGPEGRPPVVMPPCTGRASRARVLKFYEDLEAGGTMPMERAIDEALKRHTGKGIAVLLSDFLTFGSVESALNRLHASGLEPFAIQILSPSEIDPDIDEDVRFVDSELKHSLDVSAMKDLMTLYHEHRWNLEQRLAAACRQRGGRFVSVSSAEPVERVVVEKLIRGGWLR